MSKLDLLYSDIDSKAFGEHTKGSITQLVVAHVKNLEVSLCYHVGLDRLNMCICELVAH